MQLLTAWTARVPGLSYFSCLILNAKEAGCEAFHLCIELVVEMHEGWGKRPLYMEHASV